MMHALSLPCRVGVIQKSHYLQVLLQCCSKPFLMWFPFALRLSEMLLHHPWPWLASFLLVRLPLILYAETLYHWDSQEKYDFLDFQIEFPNQARC